MQWTSNTVAPKRLLFLLLISAHFCWFILVFFFKSCCWRWWWWRILRNECIIKWRRKRKHCDPDHVREEKKQVKFFVFGAIECDQVWSLCDRVKRLFQVNFFSSRFSEYLSLKYKIRGVLPLNRLKIENHS